LSLAIPTYDQCCEPPFHKILFCISNTWSYRYRPTHTKVRRQYRAEAPKRSVGTPYLECRESRFIYSLHDPPRVSSLLFWGPFPMLRDTQSIKLHHYGRWLS
jgi:hypothetical protein